MDFGRLDHRVTVKLPQGAPVSDGDGGFTYATWQTLGARVPASVEPATLQSLQRIVANTTEAKASHVVTLRYLPGVSTKAVVTLHDGATDRTLYVTGYHDPGERHETLLLACNERGR